jgi:hypothetical protein
MDLPREVRNMIYYLILVATEVVLCHETALNLVLACNLCDCRESRSYIIPVPE